MPGDTPIVSNCTNISEILLLVSGLPGFGATQKTAWPTDYTLSRAERVTLSVVTRIQMDRQRQGRGLLFSRADSLGCHSIFHSANRASLLTLP